MIENNYRTIRIEICKQCPSYLLGICRKCGCYVNFKTAIKSQECPLKKWEAVNDSKV